MSHKTPLVHFILPVACQEGELFRVSLDYCEVVNNTIVLPAHLHAGN